jgi:hypothetical protein
LRVLFVIRGPQETSTVFDVAKRMARRGHGVVFMFVQEGAQHASEEETVALLSYAEDVNCLGSECPDRVGSVTALDYAGWVGLLEDCDRVVSWG